MKKSVWWYKKYGKDSICAITKTRLRPGRDRYGLTYALFLPCKHGFSRTALVNWVFSIVENGYDDTVTCPLCRRQFDPVLVFI